MHRRDCHGVGARGECRSGLALDSLSVRGPFLLYMTNILGIVFAGSLVFFWRYYLRRLLAVLTLAVDIRQFDHRRAALGDQYG